jgi:hypothetical protein
MHRGDAIGIDETFDNTRTSWINTMFIGHYLEEERRRTKQLLDERKGERHATVNHLPS